MRELAEDHAKRYVEGFEVEAVRARAFAGFPFSEEGTAVAEDAGYFETAARYVPNLLNLFAQMMAEDEAAAVDGPAVLGTISAPVLVLQGSAAKPFFTTSARRVVGHVPNAQVREIPGVAHAALLTHPETFAEALTEFFAIPAAGLTLLSGAFHDHAAPNVVNVERRAFRQRASSAVGNPRV